MIIDEQKGVIIIMKLLVVIAILGIIIAMIVLIALNVAHFFEYGRNLTAVNWTALNSTGIVSILP